MADAELQRIITSVKNEIAMTMINNMDACRKMFATHASNAVFGGTPDKDDMAPEEMIGSNKYISRTAYGPYGGTYGVGDERSYEVTVDRGGLSMNIESTVQGNPRYADSEGWDSGNITDILEGGSGYHWTHSWIYGSQPYPRPWMEQAGDDFVDNLLGPMIDIALTNLLGG